MSWLNVKNSSPPPVHPTLSRFESVLASINRHDYFEPGTKVILENLTKPEFEMLHKQILNEEISVDEGQRLMVDLSPDRCIFYIFGWDTGFIYNVFRDLPEDITTGGQPLRPLSNGFRSPAHTLNDANSIEGPQVIVEIEDTGDAVTLAHQCARWVCAASETVNIALGINIERDQPVDELDPGKLRRVTVSEWVLEMTQFINPEYQEEAVDAEQLEVLGHDSAGVPNSFDFVSDSTGEWVRYTAGIYTKHEIFSSDLDTQPSGSIDLLKEGVYCNPKIGEEGDVAVSIPYSRLRDAINAGTQREAAGLEHVQKYKEKMLKGDARNT